jgi:PAS domain S-box-containing protein
MPVVSRFVRAGAVLLVTLAVLQGPARAQPLLAERTDDLRRPAVAFGSSPGPVTVPIGQSRLRRFATVEGLRNLVIYSIAQDGDGALWVGSDDGADRFDGERFHHFSLAEGLLSLRVTALGVDPQGRICAGGANGLACKHGERFARVAGVPDAQVFSLVSAAGALWVATDQGLFALEDGATRARRVALPAAHPSPARALWSDGSRLLVSSGATVLARGGVDQWTAVLELDRTGVSVSAVITDLLVDSRGALWVRAGTRIWRLPAGAPAPLELSDGLPAAFETADVAHTMVDGPRGEVWVGTDVGVARFSDGRWLQLSSDLHSGVRTVFADREGNLWLGSAGLLQWRGRGLFERFSSSNGLPAAAVWKFRRDDAGTLWIGTDKCLSYLDVDGWRCLAGSEGRTVRSFAFPPQGGVFFAGIPADLSYLSPTGQVTRMKIPSPLAGLRSLALEVGPEGDLWIATSDGLFRLPGAVPGQVRRVNVSGSTRPAIYSSLLLSEGKLWAASSRGLVRFDGRDVRVFGAADGLRDDAMRYLTETSDHRICVAYTEAPGITCFRDDGGQLADVRALAGGPALRDAKIYFLGEDAWRRMWVGCGDGLVVISEHGSERFTERDGLAGDDATANAFFADRDGSLWLGSVGGATRAFAGAYVEPVNRPRTMIRSGQLGERSIVASVGASRQPTELSTPHDRGALALELGVDLLVDVDRVEYSMRLLPLESQWSDTRSRQARYPALHPGEYRLEVRARIDGGPWGEVTALSFRVLSAWWQRWWVPALAAVLAIAALAHVLVRRQRAALDRKTRQLDEQAHARLRGLLDSIPEMVIVQQDGALIYYNQAAQRLFPALSQPDALRDLRRFVHPEDIKATLRMLERAERLAPGAAPEVVEVRLRSPQGDWRLFEMWCARVDLGAGVGTVTSGRDMTERQRLRAKLLLSDRMASLGTLAAGIAHEINNPLTYVIGNLEFVAEALPSDEDGELASSVADARDGAERVRKIVAGLRSFSRGEEDEPVAVDPREVVQTAIRLTANEVRHRAKLETSLADVPKVLADPGQLTQVFVNLIVNAAHAIAAGHWDDNRILVRSYLGDDGRVVLEVSDTGCGMKPEVLAHAFDPFFSTKGIGDGTGLGLSICHGIIDGIGGQIALDSTPGHGTTVRVTLPATGATATRSHSPSAPTLTGTRGKVLVIDDEPQIAETLARTLARDHDITVEGSGRDALRHIVAGARFDAIVSDVMMPNMTGLELHEQLAQLAPDQAERLIFLSGGVFTASTQDRLTQLGKPPMAKPVASAELRRRVMEVVCRPAEPRRRTASRDARQTTATAAE